MYKEELVFIVRSIVESNTDISHIAAAEKLSFFYKKITTVQEHLSKNNETIVTGGVALSSFEAGSCVDDYLRTVFFIKGIHKALTKLCIDYPEKSINILYAGCGPYATLLLPLLSLFEKERINAILLDINVSSLNSVQNLISIIGLEEYKLQLIEANAITYSKPENFIIDLAISETMHYGLTREPQVAIVKNIIAQMPAHGILIPQEINIDLAYTFFAKEPFVNDAVHNVKGHNELQPYAFRIDLGRLFTISKEHFNGQIKSESKFESNFYNLPDDYSNHPDLCLFTELVIFEDTELKTAESYITNPYCVTSLYNFEDTSTFQLVYDITGIPQWTYNLQDKY